MVRRRGLLHHGRISSQGTPPKESSGNGDGGFFFLVGDGTCSKRSFRCCSIQERPRMKVYGQLFGVREGG